MNPIANLIFRANYQPSAIAIQTEDISITYHQLMVLVKKLACSLRNKGIKSDQFVVTAIPDKIVDWVVTLALFHEGVATCSNAGYEAIDEQLGVDWLITDGNINAFPVEKTISIDNDWMSSIQKETAKIEYHPYPSEDAVIRILLTSGTTGRTKAVALSLADVSKRINSAVSMRGPHANILNMMGLSTLAGFQSAFSSLNLGLTLFHETKNPEQLIAKFGISQLYGSPQQLSHLADSVGRDPPGIPGLKTVRVSGSFISKTFYDRISKCLTSEVINDYGSTEVGHVGSYLINEHHLNFTSVYLLPGVDVQIVSQSDEPLGQGEEGLIRIRTPYMVRHYYKNPDATAQSFRNGWFYPGDRGRLRNDGLLELAGRDNEVINRGEVKIDPGFVDEVLLGFQGIKDAAAFAFTNKSGLQDVAAAIVVTGDFDMNKFQRELLDKVSQTMFPSVIVRIGQIPRNRMGKVMRAHLSQGYAELLARNERSALIRPQDWDTAEL